MESTYSSSKVSNHSGSLVGRSSVSGPLGLEVGVKGLGLLERSKKKKERAKEECELR